MITLLQRVAQARVEVAGQVIGAIEQGLLMLVCAEPTDTEDHALRLIDKVLKLRVFSDAAGKMNRSLQDVGGGLRTGLLDADIYGPSLPILLGIEDGDRKSVV